MSNLRCICGSNKITSFRKPLLIGIILVEARGYECLECRNCFFTTEQLKKVTNQLTSKNINEIEVEFPCKIKERKK